MLTKTQATTIANQSVATVFMARLAAQLDLNATNGVIGVTAFPYPPNATVGQINAFTAARQAEGWTVVVDNVGFTVTLS